MYDNINQILAIVRMYLGMVKSGQGATDDLVERSYEYVGEALVEVRRLSHSLVAPSLGDIGLKESLEELIEVTSLVKGLHVRLVVDEK